MSEEFDDREDHGLRSHKKKRSVIIAGVTTAAILLIAAWTAISALGPKSLNRRTQLPESQTGPYITISRRSITIVNTSPRDWPGGNVTINGQDSTRLPPIPRNQMREIPFRNRMSGQKWFNPRNKIETVTVQPEGAPSVQWVAPKE